VKRVLPNDYTEEHGCDGCEETVFVTSERATRGEERLEGRVSILVRPFKLVANRHQGERCPIVCSSECLALLGPEWERDR